MTVSHEGGMKHTLDVCGLACPLPVLKAKKAIKSLPSGSLLTVLATDPGSLKDFETFCQLTGHQLESVSESNGIFTFQIRTIG